MKFIKRIFNKAASGKKVNCWEYNKCGREPGGENVQTLGVCPAVTDETYNGFNSGTNSGRFCWYVAGRMFSDEEPQCLNGKKFHGCTECRFLNKVANEELKNFIFDLNTCPPEKLERVFINLLKKQKPKPKPN